MYFKWIESRKTVAAYILKHTKCILYVYDDDDEYLHFLYPRNIGIVDGMSYDDGWAHGTK